MLTKKKKTGCEKIINLLKYAIGKWRNCELARGHGESNPDN